MRDLTGDLRALMVRFEVEATEAAATVRRARDANTGCDVLLERSLRSERLRQLQAVPRCAAIALFERLRDDHRLQLVHPAPLVLAHPVDEFEVAQAVGSMLDGLAWLHRHGVAHGAVDAMALTAGPTGGRLSLAGAFSCETAATPADDVYAASALALQLIAGYFAWSDASVDASLAQVASPAVAEAISAGLDADAARRPNASVLATMVRGEFLPPVLYVDPREPLLARLSHLLRTYAGTAVTGIAAAVAMIVLASGYVAADRRQTQTLAMVNSLAEEPATADVATTRRPATLSPSTTSTTVAVTAPEPPVANTAARAEPPAPVVVLASAAVAPAPLPPTTTLAPAPTTTVPQPAAAPARSTPAITTRRATTTTTTTAPKPAKGKGSNKSDDDDDEDDDDDDDD